MQFFNHDKLVWILWGGPRGKFSSKLSWMIYSTKNVMFCLLKTYNQNGDSNIEMHILCCYAIIQQWQGKHIILLGLSHVHISYVNLFCEINLILVCIVLGQWLWHSFQIIAKHDYWNVLWLYGTLQEWIRLNTC